MDYITPQGKDKLAIVRGSDGAVLDAGTAEFVQQLRYLTEDEEAALKGVHDVQKSR
jgi:hypothetical protein